MNNKKFGHTGEFEFEESFFSALFSNLRLRIKIFLPKKKMDVSTKSPEKPSYFTTISLIFDVCLKNLNHPTYKEFSEY